MLELLGSALLLWMDLTVLLIPHVLMGYSSVVPRMMQMLDGVEFILFFAVPVAIVLFPGTAVVYWVWQIGEGLVARNMLNPLTLLLVPTATALGFMLWGYCTSKLSPMLDKLFGVPAYKKLDFVILVLATIGLAMGARDLVKAVRNRG